MQKIDRRWLYLLLFLAVAIPVIRPMGLPISIVKETQGFFDAIEALQPGDVMMLTPEYGAGQVPEVGTMTTSAFRHAMRKGVRVLMFGVWPDGQGPTIAQGACEEISQELGKTYGVDWVNLGYKPGLDVTLKKMVEDIWDAAVGVDIRGNSLADLPMMQDVRKASDCKLVANINIHGFGLEKYMAFIGIPSGITVIGGNGSAGITEVIPFYASGQLKGLLMGMRGAAEYELLIGKPDRAVVGMDAQSAAHVIIIVFVVLANLGYLAQKRRGPSGAPRS
jgi:hypothetical protein